MNHPSLPVSPKLQSRIMLYFVLAAVLPILAITIFLLNDMRSEKEKEAYAKNEQLALRLSEYIEQFLDKPLAVLSQVNKVTQTQNLISGNLLSDYLITTIENYKLFDMIKILDKAGNITHVAPFDENILGINMAHQDYFREASELQKPVWTQTFISPQTGLVTLILCMPLDDGFIIGNINLTGLSQITDKVKTGSFGYAALTDANGVIIAHPDRKFVAERVEFPDYDNICLNSKVCEKSVHFDFSGESVIGSFVKINTVQWMAAVIQPAHELLAPINQLLFRISSGMLGGILLALTIALVSLKQILKPLRKLTAEAEKISHGNMSFHEYPASFREIDALAESLKTMLNAVKNREQSLFSEIAERKSAEQKITNLRNYLSNIINSMPSMMVGVNVDGEVTLWNKTAEKITGYSTDKAVGQNLLDIFPRLALKNDLIMASIHSRKIKYDLKVAHERDDSVFYEDFIIYPLITNGAQGAVIRIDDVTTKIRMEEMLVQNEKMLSVGGLAAGMAHEINNPLAGMMQTAGVISGRLSSTKKIKANILAAEAAGTSMESIQQYMEKRDIYRMLDAISESGRRLATIVENMLSFARKTNDSDSESCILEVMDKALELAETDYDLKKQYDFKQIKIKKHYKEPLPYVPCDAGKIQQVLLNILRNGAQAMQEAEIAHPTFQIRIKFKPKSGRVVIEIEDNGPGISEKISQRIFEPFFTTKPVGVGTGLGLSISYFIITENHGGELLVKSKPGKGARFIVRLPVSRNGLGPVG